MNTEQELEGINKLLLAAHARGILDERSGRGNEEVLIEDLKIELKIALTTRENRLIAEAELKTLIELEELYCNDENILLDYMRLRIDRLKALQSEGES